jgi:rRNA-processing protein FCF1
MKIILDTNFLLLPAQFKLDIFSELRKYGSLATMDACIRELERMGKGRGRSAGQAKIALALIKKKRIKTIETRQSADTALLNHAKEYGYAVATNDRKLIKRLKSNGIRIIRLRQRKYLTMV